MIKINKEVEEYIEKQKSPQSAKTSDISETLCVKAIGG